MKKESILLLGGNFYPELTGIGKYNGEMMQWLAKEGHDCTVITSYPYYPQWEVEKSYAKRCYWFKTEQVSIENSAVITVIRCPHYIPKNPSGKTRLISEFSFLLSAFCVVISLTFKKKFNHIISVAPPFEIGLLGIFYKFFRGGNLLYHIQDLQIDAARDLKMIKSEKLLGYFLKAERFIIKNSNYISTISHGMIEKVNHKTDKTVHYFPNWVDTNKFYPIDDKAVLKNKFGFKATDTVVLYSGAIGQKQGLEAVLDSAQKLETVGHIKFAICGSGPYQEKLVKLKDKMQLKNVFFLPLQPSSVFNSFLNMADIHLIIQKAGTGDLMMPSKLSNILSIGGVALVTANPGSSLHTIITTNKIAVIIKPEDSADLTKAIMELEPGKTKIISKSARDYAESHLSTDKILSGYFSASLRLQTPERINKVIITS